MRIVACTIIVCIACHLLVVGCRVGAQRSDSDRYAMMQDADSLRVAGRYASASAIYDSVRAASTPVQSPYDSVLVASALCNTGQIQWDRGRLPAAGVRFRQCAAYLSAMDPAAAADFWDDIAAFHGASGDYCLQMKAWAHAARTAAAAGDSALVREFDACAGRALRKCDAPLSGEDARMWSVWVVIAVCAAAGFILGRVPSALDAPTPAE